MTTSQRHALALGQLAMLFVGSAVAAASLLADYPILTGQAVRYAVAAAGMWTCTRLRGRRLPRLTRRDAGWVFGVALVGLSGFNVVLIEATARIDPSVVGAVLGSTPIALAILGPLQAGRPIARRTLACALVVAAGVLLVERASGPLEPLGMALALLVLAGEVGFSLLAVRPLQRIGAVGVSFHAVWIAAVQLAVGALLLERHALRWPTTVEAGALAHMAVFVTVVAFVAWYTALQRLGADRAGLLVGTVAVTALATTALVDRGVPVDEQVAEPRRTGQSSREPAIQPPAIRQHGAHVGVVGGRAQRLGGDDVLPGVDRGLHHDDEAVLHRGHREVVGEQSLVGPGPQCLETVDSGRQAVEERTESGGVDHQPSRLAMVRRRTRSRGSSWMR